MNDPIGHRAKAPLTFKSLHWGTEANRVSDMSTLADAEVVPVAEIAAVSYVTVKDDKADIFRHEFSKHMCEHEERERGPYLLRYDPHGNLKLGKCPDNTISIGHLIDIETVGGERYFCSDCLVVTDEHGRHVWITSPSSQVPFQIEARDFGHFVTVHGIEE